MLDRILIIDDSEDVAPLVYRCLHKHWPDALLETYDPRCGLPEENFSWYRYNLLLLDFDLALPGENGLDWLKALRGRPLLPPVVMLTAYGSEKLAAAATSGGASGFMEKDKLSPDYFLNKINEIFNKHDNLHSLQTRQSVHDEMTEILDADEVQQLLTGERQNPSHAEPVSGKTRIMQPEKSTGRPVQGSVSPPRGTTGSGRRRPADRGCQPIQVPGYSVRDKIGEGGMASIYLAQREEDQLEVVLKVLHLADEENAQLLRRFMREYKLIAQIEHPHIVQIHERAFASDFAYIAMEYFPHGDLTARLQKGLDTHTAMSYLKQIATGLGAAHQKGIVHRDMKPANILFRTPDTLAITDFGIAKIVEIESRVKQDLTMDGTLMGTLYYISPEQIEGTEADQRSDIYSLGVIMYKMLTGMHPYNGTTPYEVFEGHLTVPIPSLPDKFSDLQPLLDGLLAKDPDERFQSTDELVMGIEWNNY